MYNSAQIKYEFVSDILENYKIEDWIVLKENDFDYILCPASAKIKLNKSWKNEDYMIYKINSHKLR